MRIMDIFTILGKLGFINKNYNEEKARIGLMNT